jgi:hypothetical protein
VINVIAGAFFDDVRVVSSRHAERGGDPRDGLVWLPGSREAFLGDLRGVELGSDHQVFEDSSFGVPMVYFHDWPDVTIHTNKDLPENLDATKLGRVAYLGAGIAWTLIALPDTEAPRLLAMARAEADTRMVSAELRGALVEDSEEASVFRQEAAQVGAATLRTVGDLWPSVAAAARESERRLRARSPRVSARDGRDLRVPVRSPDVRGPLDVYYYDHLEEVLGESLPALALLGRENGDVLAYECLNLVDGGRTVAEIRDVLSGRYAPVPVPEVAAYLERLAGARVVSWRQGEKP